MVDISKKDMDRIEGLIEKLNSMKYVVETGSNENGWYRIWSDGWIEQGNVVTSVSGSGSFNVYFPKSFSNNSYTLSALLGTSDGTYWINYITKYNNYFVGNCCNYRGTHSRIPYNWYACGY